MVDYFDKNVRKRLLNELVEKVSKRLDETDGDADIYVSRWFERCRECRKLLQLIGEESKITLEEKDIKTRWEKEE